MINGMNHVGVSVSNMDRALSFYQQLLGMELMVRRTFGDEKTPEREKYRAILGLEDAHGEVALLRRDGMAIELFAFDTPVAKLGDPRRPVCDHGITHFCLQVTDIHAEYARLKASGIVFHCPPQEFPGKANATYGRDPDGNVFELLEPFDKDSRS